MAETMVALGAFRFAVGQSAFSRLRRRLEMRWASQDRIGRDPARQFVGPGSETIELEGVIYPHYHPAGLLQIELMRKEAGLGKPVLFVAGYGAVFGKWCIESIEETGSYFMTGGVPRKIEFRVKLSSYGEEGSWL